MPAWPFVFYCLTVKIGTLGERPLLAQSGRFASEPEAVALDCALRFESPPNSRPSMVCTENLIQVADVIESSKLAE